MLVDTKQGVRARLLEMRNWLKTLPEDGWYNWSDSTKCLFCQFTGRAWDHIDKDEFGGRDTVARIGYGSSALTTGGIGMPGHWSYGQALARIEEVLAQEYDMELAA